MKNQYIISSVLLLCLFSLESTGKDKDNFLRRFQKNPANQVESSNTLLYKPGKSVNYFWNQTDWMMAGTSRMTYTMSGRISSRIDSGFSNMKTTYTYDSQERETEQLNQSYNSASQTWDNTSRSVTVYDNQGNTQERRSENWSGTAWEINYGSRDLRTYNGQNLLTEHLQKEWNNTASDWVNTNLDTDFQYDGQSRLQNYTSKIWESIQWVNDEKSLWNYGMDNKPNQVTIQSWNGNAFVDSNRVIDITWFNWSGNLDNSAPQQYTMQKLFNGNWANYQRYSVTMGLNGSESTSIEIFVNNAWVFSERFSSSFDEQQNMVIQLDESYDMGLSVWDTTYAYYNQNTYDGQGRILETITYSWDNTLNVFEKMMRSVFSEHSVFTGNQLLYASSKDLEIVPNPANAGEFVQVSGLEGNYSISDLTGRQRLSGFIFGKGSFSTEGLSPGIYFLLFQPTKGQSQSGRLVVK